MPSISLRTGGPALRLRSLQSARMTKSIAPSRSLYSILPGNTLRQWNTHITHIPNPLRTSPMTPQHSTLSIRPYSSTKSSKPTADLLIEELQDLYEIAKDEFEIATDSTDGATIYAASDRESARDALNQLCAVYHLYTARPGEDVDNGVRHIKNGVEGQSDAGEDAVVETNFNPEDVGREVREEVRRRVGQRVRELRNAVEVLEERAHAE